MKSTLSFLLLVMLSLPSFAQQNVTLKKLWTRPEVHLIFGQYNIYFTIKDIDKAMGFLPDLEKEMYGDSSGLDTNRVYTVELEQGRHMEYHFALQPLLQNGVGAFLLLSGHAYIETNNGRKVKTIEVHIGQAMDFNGFYTAPVTIYEPETQSMVFSGAMDTELYHKDLGVD
jgi:hypothetical protein